MEILTQTNPVDELLLEVAATLTLLWQARDQAADAHSWRWASYYVTAYKRLERSWKEEKGQDPSPQRINKAIRSHQGYAGPGGSQLSDALRVHHLWPEVFRVDPKKSTYDVYRRLAVCSLRKPSGKEELRAWVERDHPTQATVRAAIREQVDAERGVYRPDFELKTSNCWRFSDATQPAEFDGGIHPELIANLLYYYTNPDEVAIDPMAGGDTLYKVTQRYRFFRERHPQLAHSGPRQVHRSDIEPRWEGMAKADVREQLPYADEFAHFCLLDPPYYKTAAGMYTGFGDTMDEWRTNMKLACKQVARVLRPGGSLAIVVDDYLRKQEFHPLAAYAFEAALNAGLTPHGAIYNTYPNFVVTMGPLEMGRCKAARLLVSQVKVVQVFVR